MSAARPASAELPPLQPRINRNRCEGQGDCARVCPRGVFEIAVLPVEQRAGLSIVGLMKGYAHGWRQALTPGLADCSACGLCVAVCPERAISLVRPLGQNAKSHAPNPAA